MAYEKGIHTREHIYQTAKHLMYEWGYKKTTVSMIAQAASVPLGLVNYYFKKQDFLGSFLTEWSKTILSCITTHVEQELHNELERHILYTKILLLHVFSDEKLKNLYLEIFIENSLPASVHEAVRAHQVSIIRSFHVPITPAHYYLCSVAEYGAKRELFQLADYMNSNDPEFDKMIDLLATISIRIAGLSPEIIAENIAYANSLLLKIDHTKLQFI